MTNMDRFSESRDGVSSELEIQEREQCEAEAGDRQRDREVDSMMDDAAKALQHYMTLQGIPVRPMTREDQLLGDLYEALAFLDLNATNSVRGCLLRAVKRLTEK